MSITRSRLALLSYLVFLITNGIGVLLSLTYNASTPDLYENNAHHKIGWIATWIMVAQVAMGVLLTFSQHNRGSSGSQEERAAFLPVSVEAMAHHHQQAENIQTMNIYQWHRDSGQGTERASSSLNSLCASSAEECRDAGFERPIKPEANNEAEYDDLSRFSWTGRFFRPIGVERFLNNHIPNLLSHRVLAVLGVIYSIIDRLVLILGFVAISTGAVTYGGIMVS